MASQQDLPKMGSLESKVDQLVHLLQSQQRSPGHSAVSSRQRAESERVPATLDNFTVLTPPGGSEDTVFVTPLNPLSSSASSIPQNTFSSPATAFTRPILPCAGEPSTTQAEEYFHTFRTTMLQFFPVVSLNAADTSQKLKVERPFLWLCIMAVACNSTSQQVILGESVKAIVAREVICQSRKNTELLLGLLIFTAWCVRYATWKLACRLLQCSQNVGAITNIGGWHL